jgi:hypothetical protein
MDAAERQQRPLTNGSNADGRMSHHPPIPPNEPLHRLKERMKPPEDKATDTIRALPVPLPGQGCLIREISSSSRPHSDQDVTDITR